MADNCPPKKCLATFEDPRLIKKGTAFINVEQDCSAEQGILYLTDDAGLLNVSDPSLGPWLTTDNTQEVSSTADLATHYQVCDSIYRELSCFFSERVRPPKIIVGLVDAGETLSEAFTRITACPVCAMTVQTAVYRNDGTLFVDNADYFAFTQLVDGTDGWIHKPITAQASTAFTDLFETTSWAAQAAANGQSQPWHLMDVGCAVVYDTNCDPVLDIDGNSVIEPYYLNPGLTGGGFSAYHSVDDPSYNFTINGMPSEGCHTGRFLDETTGTPGDLDSYDVIDPATLGQGALQNLTGLADGAGAPVIGATRHLSAFLRTSNGKSEPVRYQGGLYVDGTNYSDVFYKEAAIDADVRCALLDFKDAFGTTLTEAGQRAEALVVQRVLDRWIDRGVINPDPFEWAGIQNIIVNGRRGNGEGYYIAATPLDQLDTSLVNARAASFLQYCPRINTPQHTTCLQVCKQPPIVV